MGAVQRYDIVWVKSLISTPFFHIDQQEYWIESDEEIESDLCTSSLPPQDVPLETPDSGNQQSSITVRWIVFFSVKVFYY